MRIMKKEMLKTQKMNNNLQKHRLHQRNKIKRRYKNRTNHPYSHQKFILRMGMELKDAFLVVALVFPLPAAALDR